MSNHFLQMCINTRCLGIVIKKFTPYFLLDFWQLHLSIYIGQGKKTNQKPKLENKTKQNPNPPKKATKKRNFKSTTTNWPNKTKKQLHFLSWFWRSGNILLRKRLLILVFSIESPMPLLFCMVGNGESSLHAFFIKSKHSMHNSALFS